MLFGTGMHRLKASLINSPKKEKRFKLKGTRKQKQKGDEREGGDEHKQRKRQNGKLSIDSTKFMDKSNQNPDHYNV